MSASLQFGDETLTAHRAPLEARLAFLRATYGHLTLAVVAFVALSSLVHSLGIGEMMLGALGGGGASWLVVLGGFMLISWIAQTMASPARSTAVQYVGLALFVGAYSILFAPLLAVAVYVGWEASILPAAVVTLMTFGGLTGYVLVSKKDFSFLGGFMIAGGFAALALIVLSVIFGFQLGIWFSGAMVLFACGAILYDTSKILHSYRTDQYVGASLALFASVMLLFWYVLQIFLSARR